MNQPKQDLPVVKRRRGRPMLWEGHRDELVLRVQELRASRISFREIGEKLKVSKSLVVKLWKETKDAVNKSTFAPGSTGGSQNAGVSRDRR